MKVFPELREKKQDKKKYEKVFHKRRVKFDNYKNCLEATQLENKLNHPEKNK